MTSRVIFVDLNSYFASVEQAERPELMGKPVAVVPMLADTTCCLAASYPAKARGVRTGTLVKDARKLCPGIQFIEADHKKYVAYHHKVLAAVERCLPIWKVLSIDEMAIKLFGREQEIEFATAKALEIKKRILEEVHPALTCSIGIAPNRYLAKIASDMQKPDGLVTIHAQELPQRLYSLSLRDFPGVGPRMEERFMAARCASAKALCQKSKEEMRLLWGGKWGEDFWRLIHGEELPERETVKASIGHSRVLGPQSRTAEAAWANLVALLSKAAIRLRTQGYFTKSLSLSLKLLRSNFAGDHWEKRVRFEETQDTDSLVMQLEKLWATAPQHSILRVGVALTSLVPSSKRQLSLFEDRRREMLMSASDKLNKKYRRNLIVVAESIELRRSLRAPIAFSHIPAEYE